MTNILTERRAGSFYEENEKSYLAQNKTSRAVVLNGKLPIQNVAAKTGEAEGNCR